MVLDAYKEALTKCMQLYCSMPAEELSPIIDYSINKRYKEEQCQVVNTYTNRTDDMTLLALADYIAAREPIVTAHGTMFKKHGTVPNPLGVVIQQFLDKRNEDKAMMFTFPKGSEDFEKYNLLQS